MTCMVIIGNNITILCWFFIYAPNAIHSDDNAKNV